MAVPATSAQYPTSAAIIANDLIALTILASRGSIASRISSKTDAGETVAALSKLPDQSPKPARREANTRREAAKGLARLAADSDDSLDAGISSVAVVAAQLWL
jgi:hypothetical protein